MTTNVLIIGCGYTGLRLATRLIERGCRVTGTARSDARIAAMRDAGVEPVTGALDDAATLRRLVESKPGVVVYFVPPPKSGVDPLPGIVQAFRSLDLEAFIFTSTTSVYGDHKGAWVDETTPVLAATSNDPARVHAEQLVLDAGTSYGMPMRICRISGIYGPGRTLRPLLKSGRYALIKGRDTWVGRIHVDDLVTGIIATWLRGENGQVYNMVDQCPHLASEFANLAADLHHLPRPEWIGEAVARQRYSDAEFHRKVSNKRIRCARLVNDLGVQLQYPNFRKGLPASVAEDCASAA